MNLPSSHNQPPPSPGPPSSAPPPKPSGQSRPRINGLKIVLLAAATAVVLALVWMIMDWLFGLLGKAVDSAVSTPGPGRASRSDRSETHEFARFCALLLVAVALAKLWLRRGHRPTSTTGTAR